MFRHTVNASIHSLEITLLNRVNGLEEAYETALDLHGEDHPLTQRIDHAIGVIYIALESLSESSQEVA